MAFPDSRNKNQRNNQMKKPKNTKLATKPKTEIKAESIPDTEHDQKKDFSFMRFPDSVRREREEYGHYNSNPNY